MKRREAREREQTEARERANQHRDELIARLRGGTPATPGNQPDQPDQGSPPVEPSAPPQVDAVSDPAAKRRTRTKQKAREVQGA